MIFYVFKDIRLTKTDDEEPPFVGWQGPLIELILSLKI
jgi:hypothetical protein